MGSGRRKPARGRRRPIVREPIDDGFVYRLNGRRIAKRAEIERIEALAIPPAWTEVEIARSPAAKVLARGLDAAGRTQRIYHPAFRARRDRLKFERLERFGRALPKLRARVDRDLRRRRLTRDRVVACVVRLIDEQLFRVGNPEYASQYGSYGITTLRRRHLSLTGRTATFDFVGKSGQRQRRSVRDERLARLLARLSELPGTEVFRFFDEDGLVRRLRSRHVNDYVKRHMGEEFTAKDFRTWGGTVLVANALLELDQDPDAPDAPDAQKVRDAAVRDAAVRDAVRAAAERLGNTPAVVRSSYVDPRVLDAAEQPRALARVRKAGARMRPRRYLGVGEQRTIALLAEMKR